MGICIESIKCVNVERCGYIIYQHQTTLEQKCVAKFIEQENDAGEVQYVFVINWDVINEEDERFILIPGIDLTQHRKIYIRSYEEPYFVECNTMQTCRADLPIWLEGLQLTYYDKFEAMLRSRCISHHSNCYLARTPDDRIENMYTFKAMEQMRLGNYPNLNEVPENVFHTVTEFYDGIDYDPCLRRNV